MDFIVKKGVLVDCRPSDDQYEIGSGEALRLYCWESEMVIPDDVKTITSESFEGYDDKSGWYDIRGFIEKISIPEDVTKIEEGSFEPFPNLCEIIVDEDNPCYVSIGGVLYTKDLHTLLCCPGQKKKISIPDRVTRIGAYAFNACKRLISVTIPDSVTSIGDSAFTNCSSLTSATIPDSVTSIGKNVFYGCGKLKSRKNIVIENGVLINGKACSGNITIPDGVTRIGGWAFAECSSLTSVTIPDGVTSIGSCAFKDCSGLTSVTIPNSVTSIEVGAFSFCKSLTSVTIPDGVTSIGSCAFKGCSVLTSVMILKGITSIDVEAFAECSRLTYVTIPNSVTRIGDRAFNRCSCLTSVRIPDSVTSIENAAFYRCKKLKSITIGNYVTRIGEDAFGECEELKSVKISKSVTSIGDRAFSSCRKLVNITVAQKNTCFSDKDGVLYSKNMQKLIFCPEGKIKVAIPEGVTSIADKAFSGCSSLTSVVIAGKDISLPANKKGVPIDDITNLIFQKDYAMNMDHDVKLSVIAGMFRAGYDEEGVFAYVKKNFAKFCAFLIKKGDVDTVQKICDNGEFLTKRNIDKYIQAAIDAGQHEIQTMLLNYKKEHFGS